MTLVLMFTVIEISTQMSCEWAAVELPSRKCTKAAFPGQQRD